MVDPRIGDVADITGDYGIGNRSINSPVPEPSTYALLGASLLGLGLLRRKR
ncbi:MAG: PEP-CTERM sorting domain-containing protein [Bryobacter sp.]|nr:PEP-CTERM sorting domain-containing protein [Bryobacter sp. CoA8 C33]